MVGGMKLTIGRLSIELRWRKRLYGRWVGDEEVVWTSSSNIAWHPFRDAHPNLPAGEVCRDGACIPCHSPGIAPDTSPDSHGHTTGARHDLPVEVRDGGHYRLV